MSTQATGTSTISTWDEHTWDGVPWNERSGAKLTHAKVTQTYEGGIVGSGSSQSLMMYPDDTTATFVGLEQIEGAIDGRSGSFVLEVRGTFADGTATATWSVVPGSGTGELRGLRGSGGYTASQSGQPNYTLDYDFE